MGVERFAIRKAEQGRAVVDLGGYLGQVRLRFSDAGEPATEGLAVLGRVQAEEIGGSVAVAVIGVEGKGYRNEQELTAPMQMQLDMTGVDWGLDKAVDGVAFRVQQAEAGAFRGHATKPGEPHTEGIMFRSVRREGNLRRFNVGALLAAAGERAEGRDRTRKPRRHSKARIQQQVPPLRSPGFPVELGGSREHHAPFFAERRTRGSLQCSVAGNPGTLRSG